MAGEIDSGWVRIGVELLAWAGTLGGFTMYVRGKLATHDSQLVEHKSMIVDLQTKQAAAVRPKDIEHLRDLLKEQEKLNRERHEAVLRALQSEKR